MPPKADHNQWGPAQDVNPCLALCLSWFGKILRRIPGKILQIGEMDIRYVSAPPGSVVGGDFSLIVFAARTSDRQQPISSRRLHSSSR